MARILRLIAHVVSALSLGLLLSEGALQMDTPVPTCEKGLSDCSVRTGPFSGALPDPCGSLYITHVQLNVTHCSYMNDCKPCLIIKISLQDVDLAKSVSDGSGDDSDEEALLKVCYSFPTSTGYCRAVTFKRDYINMDQSFTYQLLLTETMDFETPIVVIAESKETYVYQNITIPDAKTVCPSDLWSLIIERTVPRLQADTENISNEVHLHLQNIPANQETVTWEMAWDDIRGQPERWPIGKSKTVIPSDLIAPCLCFLVWLQDKNIRGMYCPFTNQPDALKRMQHNVSVIMVESQWRSGNTGLSWNVTSPCKVKAEVRLCKKDMAGGQCEEVAGSRQMLETTGWITAHKVHWQAGEFLNSSSHPLLCVQVKTEGMVVFSEPQCPFEIHRVRWTLPILVGFILICLTILGVYLIGGILKGYVWRWLKDDDVRDAVGGVHVVLLSPPDDDERVLELLCYLGSSLQTLGFTVSLDLWSKGDLCALGPVPWLHSQLDSLKRQGGKVVLVLTQTTWTRAKEWEACISENNKENIKGVETDCAQSNLPPSRHVDVFGASLRCILQDSSQGKAGERFMLVQLDSLSPALPGGFPTVPDLFCGLHVYSLPTQCLGFLTELAGSKKITSSSARRRRAGVLQKASRTLTKRLSGFIAGKNVLNLPGIIQGSAGGQEEDSVETLLIESNLGTPPSSPDTVVSIIEWC
ncbi:uncharacterized protein wu:fl23c11 [Cyprinodon tularosa]|uniref:uncharacterized protein wu:fl23c11 n=1 Tax=Cyprinodon tularosa TaxID=77115 RepID=UPI0018E277E6|nr:uncharacterized protein wu:fl23c11 [Cyprinodon tularosa]